jgi:hypothetical protein
MRRIAVLLMALSALDAAAQTIRLETMALAVKYRDGRFLALEPRNKLALIEKDGRVAARFDLAQKLAGVRRYEVLDFAQLAGGRVVVSAYTVRGLGVAGPVALLFDPATPEQPPEMRDLSAVRCQRIEGAAEGGFWCLDSFEERIRLHHFGNGDFQTILVPENDLPAPGIWMGEVRLAAPSPRSIYVWLPSRGSLIRLSRDQEKGNRWVIQVQGSGKASTSFAVDESGRVTSMLPLRKPPGFTEQLDTRYGLFRLDFARGGWTRVAGTRDFPRGSVLSGADEDGVWIWDRAGKTIERVPIPN